MRLPQDTLRLAWKLMFVTVLFASFMIFLPCSSQLISHINSKGLKGNFTFDVREESNVETLVIESLIEADQSKWIEGHQDEEIFDSSQPIMFDWSLHSNTIEPHVLSTCSNDDLGPTVSDHLRKVMTENRTVVLNKLNIWKIPLKDLLQPNSTLQTLSSLIWGKSIKLRLSTLHGDVVNKPNQTNQTTRGGGSSQSTSIGVSKPQLASISKPQLANGSSVPNKPTFAPRTKPTLAARSRNPLSPQSLPKPEALMAEELAPTQIDNATTPQPLQQPTMPPSAVSSSVLRASIISATNKRILKFYGRTVVCANIIDIRPIKTAEVVFESQVAGKVVIRGNQDDTTLISTQLYHVRSKVTTRHDWKIMASDILDNRRDNDEKCKYLQVLFDPNNIEDSACNRNDTKKCRMGDLTKKHGQVQVAGQGRNAKLALVDLNLPLSALEGSRSLFLVIYEIATKSSNNGMSTRPNILSCAQIKSASPRKVEANFNMDGVRGTIKFSQRHSTEPTSISYDLFGLEGNTKHLAIRELPLGPRTSADNSRLCGNLGDVFNPYKINDPPGSDSSISIDMFRVGNLSAKHGPLAVIDSEYEDHYMGEFLDLSLQLFGAQTIAGRSIVVHKNNDEPWVCAILNYADDEPINLAAATFYYPVVGRILFHQLSNNPHSETGVLVEVYNPNSEKKSSENHNWLVHVKPAMADFYNWSQRCESAGDVFDPILASVGLSNEVYSRQCQSGLLLNEPLRCRVGDTSLKSGFKFSLPSSSNDKTRYYYTDMFLPISGSNSIVGRSVVIYDDNSPTQRGNRLACSTVKLIHPIKASVKSWDSGPSIPSAIRGSISFEQESAWKQTRIKIDLNGFNGNVENYAIHNVWTKDDREFPCSNDSLYDIYDPYNSENSLRLPPSSHYGSSATVDRVKVGDMSRKHGTFEGLQSVHKSVVDANAPLFAPRSIVGRSVVLRAAVNDFRWVCGNIELDYDKATTREIIGIASFDEPRSKIAGYVRFVQLEHKDGSLSDTFVQVDLRMQADGVHEPPTSEGHDWAIFVNQVGEDAFIVADEVRCIAAGFKWNPYLAQDTLENYSSSCKSTEQLGCAMGDLGMRHGRLTIGPNNRRTLSDSNLPLAGNYSVMGRSLVIFDSKKPSSKLACANILPDIHLKSNVVIKRTPTFTVARFMDQMRSQLGAAEWLMVPELRSTKSVANGECVQMTIHFYGQKAHQMQVELNNLITLGTVRKSTRSGVERISTHFRLCRVGQAQQSISGAANAHYPSQGIFLLISFLTFALMFPLYNETQLNKPTTHT